MINIEGERYEYEMQVLIDCVRNDIEFIPVEIETVYIDNNSTSHFNPLKDSFKIYKIILKNFFKFMGSSIICTLIDLILFYLLSYLVLPLIGVTNIITIDWVSGFVARFISACTNFYLNKRYVFKAEENSKSGFRYALLCIVNICLSNLIVSFVETIGGTRWLIKPICDGLLYFLSYKIQNIWVFKK